MILTRSWHHKIQRSGDVRFHFFAMDDRVEHAVLEEEFAALESGWEFLADGLFDHPRTGKANERAGFGDVEIAKHCKRRGHAAGSWVGENGNVRDPGFI